MPVHDAQTPLAPHAALLLSELALPRPTTVLDVGANPINDCPYAPLLAAGGCHVIGFEPQKEAFDALQAGKGPHETYHPHAVGDGNTHTLHIYSGSGFTSLFPPHLPATRVMGGRRWAKVIERVPMQTVALDAMPDLAPFDLLKIDIQGGEAMVFDHARRAMAETVAVIVELRYLQLYEGEPMLCGVDESLRKQGFMLHKFLFNKSKPMPNSQAARLNRRRTADQLIDGDAVYLRHPGRIDSYSNAQLMHLAILAASVFHSHSTALYALDELVQRGAADADLPECYVDLLPDALKSTPPGEAAEMPPEVHAETTTEPATRSEAPRAPVAKAAAPAKSATKSATTAASRASGTASAASRARA